VKIAILDTYYPGVLAARYGSEPGLADEGYASQHAALLAMAFGTSDFYSRHLLALGHEATDLIVNCEPLQLAWARENALHISGVRMRVPHRLFRLPVAGALASAVSGHARIFLAQVEALRPDILYCQDLWFITPAMARRLRPHVGRIVGQTASPLPPLHFLSIFDLIVTSFPHYVPRLRAQGIASEYLPIAFEPRVLDLIGTVERDVGASFVGGISRHHGRALPMLEYLAQNTPIEFFGYGAHTLAPGSPIAVRHRGPVWALDMYRALARSRLTFNRHIDVAGDNANNMRLYEATGVGTLLVTDRKRNLGELFEPGREVVVYSDAAEAARLINYYLAHPDEAAEIARAGQARTLRDHTYRRRMEALVPLLEACLARAPRR
jgi:spore maturation protein CgeB